MAIHHIRLHDETLLNEQYLLDLGRVNILTGKNSSGKSTIFKTIKEKSGWGFTFIPEERWVSAIRAGVPKYGPTDMMKINDWLLRIPEQMNGRHFFPEKPDSFVKSIQEAKENSLAKNLNVGHLLGTIVNNIINEAKTEKHDCIVLSPKRRLAYDSRAQSVEKLDNEAHNALSRLFFLKNQPPDEYDRNCFERISSTFNEITGHDFDVQMKAGDGSNEIELRFRRGGAGSPWIEARNEGLGLSEILAIIAYSLDAHYDLVMIEEPENHLHPDLQRRLLAFLNSIEDRQFILSTHSPLFINKSIVDRIYLSRFDGKHIVVTDNTNRVELLGEIGYLTTDNLTSDVVILTEGKTDWLFIDHVVRQWLMTGNRLSISFIPLAGSMMQYFDPTPFAELRNTFVLLDRDTKNSGPQGVFMKRCNDLGISVHQLERYSLENYYSTKALGAVFSGLLTGGAPKLDSQKQVWQQLADRTHSAGWWEGELKSARRITKILSYMELPDVEATDFGRFCRMIAALLSPTEKDSKGSG